MHKCKHKHNHTHTHTHTRVLTDRQTDKKQSARAMHPKVEKIY